MFSVGVGGVVPSLLLLICPLVLRRGSTPPRTPSSDPRPYFFMLLSSHLDGISAVFCKIEGNVAIWRFAAVVRSHPSISSAPPPALQQQHL